MNNQFDVNIAINKTALEILRNYLKNNQIAELGNMTQDMIIFSIEDALNRKVGC